MTRSPLPPALALLALLVLGPGAASRVLAAASRPQPDESRAPAQAERPAPAVAPAPEARPAELARSWPASVYELWRDGRRAGRVTLATRLRATTEHERGERVLVCDDVTEVELAGERAVRRILARTRPADLALQRLDEWVGDEPAHQALELRFEGGVMSGTRVARTVIQEVPEGLATEGTLLRRLALLPREPGAELVVPLYDVERVRVLPAVRARAVGPEGLDTPAGRVEAWRIHVRFEEEREADLWYDADRRLVRARFGTEVWIRSATAATEAPAGGDGAER